MRDDVPGVESDSTQRQCVRRASAGDVDALIEICRQGFLESLRWHGVRGAAVNWWMKAIDTEAAETWVYAPDGVVSGVCLLVTDRELWGRQAARRKPGFGCTLASSLMHPRRAAAILLRRIAAAFAQRRNRVGASAPDPSGRTAWIELIAVLPSMRGHGVGRRLLEVCEDRTLELGCTAIGLCVDTRNESAIRLYEAIGYVRGRPTNSGWSYVKRLSRAALPR